MIDKSRYEFDLQHKKEYNAKHISGSDEVGRGAMAGPIVVASVILKEDFFDQRIKDSKLLSHKQRVELYDLIVENSISYSIKEYDAQFVDKYNPKKTSQIGMKETIEDLKVKPDLCLIDAEKINLGNNYNICSIIKGDMKSQSIAAASILAKVYRDGKLIEFSKIYPGYDFEKHKGYCTKAHIQSVRDNGICDIHRKSYKPIKEMIEV